MSKLYISAGHGGRDPGAVKSFRREKGFTLAIANKVRSLLIASYHTVINMCLNFRLKSFEILVDLQECAQKVEELEELSGHKIDKLTTLFYNKQVIINEEKGEAMK